MTQTQIEPDKFYSLNEIAELKLFPWVTTNQAIKRWVSADMKNENRLKAIVRVFVNKPTSNRFFIKGENIIKTLAAFEDGTLFQQEKEN